MANAETSPVEGRDNWYQAGKYGLQILHRSSEHSVHGENETHVKVSPGTSSSSVDRREEAEALIEAGECLLGIARQTYPDEYRELRHVGEGNAEGTEGNADSGDESGAG